MAESNENISIPKKVETGDDLDFAFLRKAGLEYIEKLAGGLWTDYNSHDPGVTLLEMLCYAITDLGARINSPFENLLAGENIDENPVSRQFFTAASIFPSKPVSEADYRKLFVDIDGVKNCWLLPFEKKVFVDCKNDNIAYDTAKLKKVTGDFVLQGLYSIIVDFDEPDEKLFPDDAAKAAEYKRIADEIAETFHANRNLCEDLVEVKKVERHPIRVCCAIEIKPDADEELIHAYVLWAIDNYFSPPVNFYSLKQMKEKGYPTDEIFEGPLLNNGFIDDSELENARLREEVRLSDLVQEIMKIDGITAIRDISIQDGNIENPEPGKWVIAIEKGKKPFRTYDSAFSYYKGFLPVNINKASVDGHFAKLRADEKTEREKAKYDMIPDVPSGKYNYTSETTTIQNDFPENYGIGSMGLPPRADESRKAKAKQLKGYLLFYDQILANYFAHLGKVKDVLSVNQTLKATWFAQPVADLSDFDALVSNYSTDAEELTESLFAHISNNNERKIQVLDHLIARFAERFSDYAFLMKQLYGKYATKAAIDARRKFLAEYGDVYEDGKLLNRGIGNWRGIGYNYFMQSAENLWDTSNVSGVEKRIARLAGIKNFNRRNLSMSLAEFYSLTDADGNKVFRWRIRNKSGEIILSATQNYQTVRVAQNELNLVVLKILETSIEEVEKGFEDAIADETEVGNFEIQQSEAGKFSFDIINREASPDSVHRIIARQYSYTTTKQELKESIIGLIEFIAEEFTEEGMFLVEHILLRPDVTKTDIPLNQFMPVCTDDCTSCHPVDPYSFRVTVVLPGWTYRFSNPDFRKFTEELIRSEMPAHILARICWIGNRLTNEPDPDNEMVKFEAVYKDFLLAKTNSGQQQNNTKLKALIKILGELNSIYPAGRLLDCDDESDATEGRILLGNAKLGTL